MSGHSEMAAITGVQDLEAQGPQHASRAVYASTEVLGAKRTARCELVGDAEDSLRVVALPIENEQVDASAAESVSRKKLILAKLVVFSGRLTNVVWVNWIPEGHSSIVGQGTVGYLWIGSSGSR